MGRKFSLLTSTALTTSTALVSGAAIAADMPVKAPPIMPYSWNGCYVGGNAGIASVAVDHRIGVPGVVIPDSDGRKSAFIGGVQAGCNWQHSPSWAFGVEGDINYVSARRSRNLAFVIGGEDFAGSQVAKLQWLATLRGRLGPTWQRSFAYATGGLAAGSVKASVNVVQENDAVFAGSNSDTRFGWVLGVGFEHAFTRAVSVKLEYLHFDLGKTEYLVALVSGASGAPQPWSARSKFSGDIVRVGINVKLNP